MSHSELEALLRAHELFTPATRPAPLDPEQTRHAAVIDRTAGSGGGGGLDGYRRAVRAQRDALWEAGRTDAAAARVIAAARNDHTRAGAQTGGVVDEARADRLVADTPLAQREAMRRRAARLRAQRAHVLAAHRQAVRHGAALRGLRYRSRPGNRLTRVSLPSPDSRAGRAVRAALSRLGRSYRWGAAGPDQFDCSGLTQWAYRQAGIQLGRTTYQQIHDGMPVSREHVRPGDLVFPNAGHVQMAIGDGLVVEAPHSGAAVRIGRLGAGVAIRRPVG